MTRKRLMFSMAVGIALLLPAGAGLAAVPGARADDPSAEADPPIARRVSTADHSRFPALDKDFKSGPEVTRACLSCHTEAGRQFSRTIHWTWLCPQAAPDAKLGKAGHSINNFCISIHGNEPRCTSCHAGYGWKDKDFDLSVEENIDCLVCHEQTGTYVKFPAGAGHPASQPTVFKGNGKTYQPPDWRKVAQSVGPTTRRNCGTCHFFGGGGDGVKHGDLDSSLFNPSRTLDVHMAVDGKNFDCTRCHTTVAHFIAGRCYQTPAATDRRSLIDSDEIKRITCESCHTATPHKTGKVLNDHTDKVACQTCHIPEFARVNPTKMWWDWSSAGAKEDGRPITRKGELGKPVYDTKKGAFRWEKNVRPEYFWFSGVIRSVLVTDKIDPAGVVPLNDPQADPGDPNARIYPFKVHRGKQPYDRVHQTMVFPKLFGPKGSGAYWADYDWQTAITAGMAYAGLPYSEEYGFVETSYVFPATHMVAPREDALACNACHVRENGRLAELAGFYMPGRDRSRGLDLFGWAGVVLALAGVLFHAAGRVLGKMTTQRRR